VTLTRWTLVWAAALLVAAAGCGKPKETEAQKGAGSAAKKGAGSKSSERASTSGARGGEDGSAPSSKSSGSDQAKGGKAAEGWYLTEADNGKHLELRPGDRILVKVRASRVNGYQWVQRDAGGDVVRRDGEPIYTASDKSGESGIESWRFRAMRPGEQSIRMEYLPPWSKTAPERVLRFTVSVAIR
jgi:predicted secreted protein